MCDIETVLATWDICSLAFDVLCLIERIFLSKHTIGRTINTVHFASMLRPSAYFHARGRVLSTYQNKGRAFLKKGEEEKERRKIGGRWWGAMQLFSSLSPRSTSGIAPA